METFCAETSVNGSKERKEQTNEYVDRPDNQPPSHPSARRCTPAMRVLGVPPESKKKLECQRNLQMGIFSSSSYRSARERFAQLGYDMVRQNLGNLYGPLPHGNNPDGREAVIVCFIDLSRRVDVEQQLKSTVSKGDSAAPVSRFQRCLISTF